MLRLLVEYLYFYSILTKSQPERAIFLIAQEALNENDVLHEGYLMI